MTFHCSPEFIRDFERYPVFRDHVLLAVPGEMDPVSDGYLTADEAAAGRHLQEDCPSVPLSAFRELPFILLSPGNNLYERSGRLFEEAGFAPRVRMHLSQLVTSYHLAEAGIGAAFVSDRLVRPGAGALHYYRLDSEITTRQFYILLPKRRYVSAASRRFIKFFRSMEETGTVPPVSGEIS